MKTKDLSQIYYILDNQVYKNEIVLKKEILNLSDDKLIKGLIVELYMREELYGLNMGELSEFADSLYGTEQDPDDLFDCYDYYVTKLIEDPYIKLMDNFDPDNIEEFSEDKFIDWVKSLSQSDVDHIEAMCVEKEQYEYIGLVLGIKDGTYVN
jgi:hypothetical protein